MKTEKKKYNIPPRDRKEKTVTIFLTKEMREKLDEHKKKTGRTYSRIVRQLLREYFNRIDRNNTIR